jgi:hypothetical protein
MSNAEESSGYANRLISEKSSYLLQHAHNPVDWFPWGEEALARARQNDRPILLSIGYAACHWCHVMERETFEREDLAPFLNRHFICVKVDREERPDLDEVYMAAVQMMTGRGGWPLNVFLTPELKPFFGGTYFPPESREGLVGFRETVERIAHLWESDRASLLASAETLQGQLEAWAASRAESGAVGGFREEDLRAGVEALFAQLDRRNGGFGGAPKFPRVPALRLLLAESRRREEPACGEAAELTLRRMADGGIQDHVGGGFHRYAVDRAWKVPHFEKMLYDQALIAEAYLDALRATRRAEYAVTAQRIFDFVLEGMRAEEGGFWASLDADNNGREGLYYTWTAAEIRQLLGKEEARRFTVAYGISPTGNFQEGRNILYRDADLEGLALAEQMSVADLERDLDRCLERLRKARQERLRPDEDNKILTVWNAMMIAALARGGAMLEEERYLRAARKAADYLLDRHWDGVVLARSSVKTRVSGPGFLDDYAWTVDACLTLYMSTLREDYFAAAIEVGRALLRRFRDEEAGRLEFVSVGDPRPDAPPVRPPREYDASVPSPVAVAMRALHRLADATGDAEFRQRAEEVEAVLAATARRQPEASNYALSVASERREPQTQVILIGAAEDDTTRRMAREVRRHLSGATVFLWAAPDEGGARMRRLSTLFEGKETENGRARAWVCHGKTCLPPVADPEGLIQALRQAPTA